MGQQIGKNPKRDFKIYCWVFPVRFIILSNASLSSFKIVLGC